MITEQLFTLPIIKQLSPSITLCKQSELPLLIIKHNKMRAAIALQGAQLLAWQPIETQPVIWLSDATPFKQGKAIRGGVPLCWPWFGPKENKPAHGFARNQPWVLATYNENPQNVQLSFILRANEQTYTLWPHDFILSIHFTLGEICHIALEAQGEFQATAALHSYFQVSDINHIKVAGLGSKYIDKITGCTSEQQEALTFSQQTDRIYTQPEATSYIVDPGLQRTIEVQHHNMSDVIAWNPWDALSCSMSDMVNEGYKTMVCVETGRIHRPVIYHNQGHTQLAVTLRCQHNKMPA